jgi:hypothetical protein
MNTLCHLSSAHRKLALAAVLGMIAVAARASVSIENTNVQIGGFFSQGYLYSDNNNLPTQDVGGTWNFREAAFNVSDTFGAHLRVGAQIFEQSFGNIGQDRVILDWAVADYNFKPWFGVRAGRVKYPKGLYGEALDLDVVRPFILLPEAVYSPILRDFTASFDGAMIYGSVDALKGSFDYKVFGGTIPINPEKGVTDFYNDGYGLLAYPTGATALKMDSVEGAQLVWNTPVSGLKLVGSYSFFKNLDASGPFAGYPAVPLNTNIPKFSWITYSAEYTVGDWVVAAEWQRTGGDLFLAVPAIGFATSEFVGWDGWYVSVSRRINDKFQVGAYYGDNQVRTGFNSSNIGDYQHDTALSLRYDLNEHVLFKVEAHYFDGTYETFNTVRIPNPNPKPNTTVLAVKTTLSF